MPLLILYSLTFDLQHHVVVVVVIIVCSNVNRVKGASMYEGHDFLYLIYFPFLLFPLL